MQAVGYLDNGEWGLLQQVGGLHQEHLVDVIDDGTAWDLPDNLWEIARCDAELWGIESNVVMLGEVDGHKTKEIEKQFLDALREPAVADSAFLDSVQFKQKQANEYRQSLQPK